MDGNNPSYWLPGSPSSSPARRWLRALWLVERGQRTKLRFDDDEIRRVKRFLSACGRDPKGPAMARKADPALADALQLFRDESPHKRWRLESYLLTTEPLETAAARCSVSLATARSYHDIFFDVRPHREARDWIWLRAIRAGAWNCFAQDFPGSVWKGFAYSAGPLALELAVAVTTDAPLPGWVRATLNLASPYEEARLRLYGKFLIAALTTDSPTELAALVKGRRQFKDLECQTPEGCDATDRMAAMEDFLKTVGASSRPANPRRVAAGKRNRALRKELTEEGRRWLQEAARRNQPWQHSTGPKTPAGKARAAQNAKNCQLGPRTASARSSATWRTYAGSWETCGRIVRWWRPCFPNRS